MLLKKNGQKAVLGKDVVSQVWYRPPVARHCYWVLLSPFVSGQFVNLSICLSNNADHMTNRNILDMYPLISHYCFLIFINRARGLKRGGWIRGKSGLSADLPFDKKLSNISKRST